MSIVEALEAGNKITITISVKEKQVDWLSTSRDLTKLPRFQAMAKQLLTRADRDNKSYTLSSVGYIFKGFCQIYYTFVWIKKNE